jgi:DNA-binding transcriptional MocR family regulator
LLKKYEAVIEYIYRCVQTGVLKQGDFLPSIRTLAQQTGASATSVDHAYSILESKGIIEGIPRKGVRLINVSEIPSAKKTDLPRIPFPEIVVNFAYMSNKIASDIVNLGATTPAIEYLPNDELSRCLSRISRTYPNEANISGFSRASLRESFAMEAEAARYIFRIHGLSIPEGEICLTNGASEAFVTALQTVTSLGDVVALESPFYPSVFTTIAHLGLRPLEIRAAYPDGLDIDELERHLRSDAPPRCLIITPNFQNPTGSLMPPENRDRLIALSDQYGFIIIEDDTLGALRGSKRLQSLKERRPDDVIYIGSFSKTIAPGYRAGWAAGGKYAYNLRVRHMVESFENSVICHLAVTEYLKSKRYLAQIDMLRETCLENSKKMISLMKAHFPAGSVVHEPKGGMYLWLTLPGGMSAEDIYYKTQEEGVLLAPGTLFGNRIRHDNSLRFCCGIPVTQRVEDAFEIAGRTAKRHSV